MTTTTTPAMTLRGQGQTFGTPAMTVRDRDADVDAVFTSFTVSGLPSRRWRLRMLIDSTPARGKGPAQHIIADTGGAATQVTVTQPYPYVRVKDVEGKVGGAVTCTVALEWLSGTTWVAYAQAQAQQAYGAPAAVKTNIPLGINTHMWSASAPVESWRPALDAVVAAGFGWVRTPLPWAYIENGGKGSRDVNMLAMLDTFMADCGTRGLKVLGITGGAPPAWATASKATTGATYKPLAWGGTPGYPAVTPAWQASVPYIAAGLGPDNWQDYEDHMTWFVGRYANGGLAGPGGTALGAVENMNEPFAQTAVTRDGGSGGPMQATSVSVLATWQQHLYAATKAANPAITVIGLVAAENDWKLLQALYDTGIFKGNYDAVSVHPYPATFKAPLGGGCYDPRFPFTDVSGEWHHHPASLGYFLDVMAANNDPAAVWVTEFGQSSGSGSAFNKSPQEQADHVAYMWKLLARYQKVGGLFMHSIEDKGADYFVPRVTAWNNFGLLRTDHVTRKPAFAAVQGVLAAIRAGTA